MAARTDPTTLLLQHEREKWVRACRARAALWRRTADGVKGAGPMREEARARANEAQFIADLIASGEAELPNA
jgi:hypothetical protein